MNIGLKILNLLNHQNITQKQLSIDLGIPQSTLNGYISNRRQPDYETLLKIANYLKVSCDYLLDNLQKDSTLSESDQITKDDLRLLSYYHRLFDTQQEVVMEQAKLMYQQNQRNEQK